MNASACERLIERSFNVTSGTASRVHHASTSGLERRRDSPVGSEDKAPRWTDPNGGSGLVATVQIGLASEKSGRIYLLLKQVHANSHHAPRLKDHC
jgi:hypothetical protein